MLSGLGILLYGAKAMIRRIVVGIFTFGALLLGGSWFLAQHITAIKDHLSGMPKVTGPSSVPDLFYREVGGAPSTSQPQSKISYRQTFALETSVHAHQPKAEYDVDRLSAKGFQAFYTPYQKGGRVVYRVRVGIFGKKQEAVTAQKTLTEAGFSSRIISL